MVDGQGRAPALVDVGDTDLLFDGDTFHEFTNPRIDTGNDHGGGDTLAAAVTCALANGYAMPDAVAFAQGMGHQVPARRIPVGPWPRTGVGDVPARS